MIVKKILFLILILFLFLTIFLYEKNIDFFNFKKDEQIQILLNSNDKLLLEIDEIEKIIDISEIEIDGKVIENGNINEIIDDNSVVVISGVEKDDITNLKKTNKTFDSISQINNENIDNLNIEKQNYSSNISNIIKITGNNLDQIDYVIIGEMSFKPEYNGDFIYVLVEKDENLNGEQFVFFQRLNGDIETYDKKINFQYSNSNIVVVNITPKIIKNDIARNIVLQGMGFSKVISIGLSNNVILKNTSFNIINDKVMSVVIPKGLEKGKYILNIMDVEGIYKTDINIEID